MPELVSVPGGTLARERVWPASEDRRRIVAVLRWSRSNGWRQSRFLGDREFTSPDELLTVVIEPAEDGTVEVTVFEVGALRYRGWPKTVTQALDVLVALGVIPAQFSSLLAGGETEWRAGTSGLTWLTETEEIARNRARTWEKSGGWLERRHSGPWLQVDLGSEVAS